MSETDNPIDSILKDHRLAEEDRERFSLFAEKLRDGTAVTKKDMFLKIQFRIKPDNGGLEWYEVKIYPKFVNYSAIPLITGTIHKMNDREVKSRNILNFYSDDKNPAIFSELMAKRVRGDLENKYAIIQFDVLGFKFINDRFGEAVGNELLHHINDVLDVPLINNGLSLTPFIVN